MPKVKPQKAKARSRKEKLLFFLQGSFIAANRMQPQGGA
jgi:hypothetical protein